MPTLAEQLLLTAINPKNGRPYARSSNALPYSLSGAFLAELMLRANVELRKKKIVVINDQADHPLLQETIVMIQKQKRPMTPKHWVSKLKSEFKQIQKIVAQHLENDGQITIEEKKILGLFTSQNYQINDPNHLGHLRDSFTEILHKGEAGTPFNQGDERYIVLLSLIEASKLLSIVYPTGKEAQAAQKQLKHVNKNLPVSKAVKETIQAIEVSVIAAIAVTTTSSNQSNS
ncbi:GPP34 family phosphoprotein [Salicibibacter cibarius]|uniref:GPP34 family phosphoprotein n=1 Tax=Salicibibacter cibarius TaxID=2743000 RepID=A0A7T7CAJ0_9BACI|nr:GPP34 family phosphoprotein [Salicibibacter cibarius]QQK74913.1 GPP34 family phosphoprotein [Salicibibacter cibarius]